MAAVIKLNQYYKVKCHKHGEHLIPDFLGHKATWSFNGDYEKPTFSPSVRHYTHDPVSGRGDITWCHYTITNGMIQYHGDCPHEFAGQTLPVLTFSGGET